MADNKVAQAVYGIRFLEALATAPSNLGSGRIGLWVDSSGRLLLGNAASYSILSTTFASAGISTVGSGTVTVTNASATITGSGTAFVADDVGRGIKLPDGKTYIIASYVSATSITIHVNYGGATLSGQSYSLLDAEATTSDEANWQEPKLTNSWATVGGLTPKFRKDSLGRVTIRGTAGSGSIGTTSAEAIFRLPVGYRPGVIMYFAVDSADAHGVVQVDTNGYVNGAVGNNAAVTLDGVNFLAEN